MDIKILVATHKKYQMAEDSIYIPIHVGKNGKIGFGYIGDDTGNNISSLNYYFNEMTAVYWAWKNLDTEYIGLVHYRRYFSVKNLLKRIFIKNKFDLVLSQNEVETLIKNSDIILPAKRRYYIETIESHYRHLPYTINSDLDTLRAVITEKHPKYLFGFEKVMQRRWAHMFNMFVMKKEYLNEYAEWAFNVLFETDKRISMEGRTPVQARLYISEFLIDTWIETKKYSYIEIPFLFMEKQSMIKKAWITFKRKLGINFIERHHKNINRKN